MASRYLEDCLGKRIIFFTGKGGVGKGTLAWATALSCAHQKAKVRLVQWNPLESVSSIAKEESSDISFHTLETLQCFKEYALQILKFKTIYHAVFDNHVLQTFIRAAPGLSETVIAGKVWDLYNQKEQDLLIVDLPASGHAVSFFQSPLGVSHLFRVGWVHREAEKICQMFSDPNVRLDLVTIPEELPVTECKELKEKLSTLHPFHFGFIHLNQCLPKFSVPPAEILHRFPSEVRQCYFRHEERSKQEKTLYPVITGLGLPILETPKMAGSKGAWEVIEQVANHLETL